ncbi:hypothetical protein EYC84_009579 [Monilinia fructicola]|uniref:Uncharacterized protein n=1 Tax=Monilinia fructicola TaxID=38448 RepID=A0A5M9J8B0_MONFR|nr:hypothetical protein EYC84_009579 [Monilinia fructicola]
MNDGFGRERLILGGEYIGREGVWMRCDCEIARSIIQYPTLPIIQPFHFHTIHANTPSNIPSIPGEKETSKKTPTLHLDVVSRVLKVNRPLYHLKSLVASDALYSILILANYLPTKPISRFTEEDIKKVENFPILASIVPNRQTEIRQESKKVAKETH